MSATLQAFKRFTAFAFAPVLYNGGIIFGILVLYPFLGPTGLAWGVVFGAMLHLLVQLPGTIKLGFRWRTALPWQVQGIKRVMQLIIPRAFALSANQVNHLILTLLASTLAGGSVVVFYNAYDIEVLPVSLVAVSIAVASFPVLGELHVKKKHEEFSKVLCNVITKTLLVMLPLTIFMILLRAHIIRLILGYGLYDWEATRRTLDVFGILAISLIAQGLIPIFARAFYAQEETKTPVVITVIAMGINILFALILIRLFGLKGIAAAFSIASFIHCILLALLLEKKNKNLFSKTLIKQTAIYTISALAAGLALYESLYIIAAIIGDIDRVWELLVQTLISFLVGSTVYVFILQEVGDKTINQLLLRIKKLFP